MFRALFASADDLVLEVFAFDLAAHFDLWRQQRQRHRVQLVAGDVGAAQIHIVAVKADDLIIPRTHRTTFFRVFFYNKVETRLCQRDVFA